MSPVNSIAEVLPSDVWQHSKHGQQWHRAGRCVTCGGEKEQPGPYHCESCHSAIFASLMDYDDD